VDHQANLLGLRQRAGVAASRRWHHAAELGLEVDVDSRGFPFSGDPRLSVILRGARNHAAVMATTAAGARARQDGKPSVASKTRQRREISYEWQRWAAVSLMEGTASDVVVARLVSKGMDKGLSVQLCDDLETSSAFEAGRWMAERLRKLESVLSMRQQMRDLSPLGADIERRRDVSAEEFLDEYYSANLPVILEDVSERWPARTLWTPDYLLEKLGDEEVEVMADRDSDPRFELNSDSHKTLLAFSDYVAHVVSTDRSNDVYVVANNHLLESAVSTPLWSDFSIDDRYLDRSIALGRTFLWFGPAGTVTPMHHDTVNVLFTQVVGEKVVTLVSPLETHCVYNDVAVYSEVDPKAPDLDRHPRFATTRRFQVTIRSGEALFIPVGWWHHVESLTTSCSISFTNFWHSNDIDWFQPNITP
jgi:hypothetical protein